ncbi:MAG: helix-turn-helix domain-containing protein [Caldilineaceae bacterium]|nr:helix-turn-helix domain-containing protein [Caldilineaceae bacterium]HRJ45004.1 helix-turn-helix domain-containing protein [Caldilineaceae bacterium]
MALYVRELEDAEWMDLEAMLEDKDGDVPIQRVMIVVLSAQGHRVQEISREVDLHPINVRKWIHRFNAEGMDGLRSGKSPGRPPVFTDEQRDEIVALANGDPRKLGLPFAQWSLQRMRKYLMDKEIVEQISVETIRQVLRSNGVCHRMLGGWSKETKSNPALRTTRQRTQSAGIRSFSGRYSSYYANP